MFGTMLYFNKEKVDEYNSLICKKKSLKVNGIIVESDKGAELSTPIGSAGIKGRTSMSGEYQDSFMLDCSEFEEKLNGRDDFFDFTDGSNQYSLSTMPISSIIKFNSSISIPEEFDMVRMVEEYKSILVDYINFNSSEEKGFLTQIMQNSKNKIPLICEIQNDNEYKLGFAKLQPNNLLIEYNEIEDVEDNDVIVLAKIISRRQVSDKEIEVYDIYKDFLGLNRAMRKQITKPVDETFNNISIDENFIGIEVLAIYY